MSDTPETEGTMEEVVEPEPAPAETFETIVSNRSPVGEGSGGETSEPEPAVTETEKHADEQAATTRRSKK